MKNHSSSLNCDYKGSDSDNWNIASNLRKIQTAGEWILLFGVSAKSKININFSVISAPLW